MKNDLEKAKVARVWQGRVPDEKAGEYEKYLYENGIKIFASIEGNLGVQVMRFSKDGVTEFTTVSYWENYEVIKNFAGDDIEKPHHLPLDKDYLSELPETVKNCDLIVCE